MTEQTTRDGMVSDGRDHEGWIDHSIPRGGTMRDGMVNPSLMVFGLEIHTLGDY